MRGGDKLKGPDGKLATLGMVLDSKGAPILVRGCCLIYICMFIANAWIMKEQDESLRCLCIWAGVYPF
jgi:hypothetical protein